MEPMADGHEWQVPEIRARASCNKFPISRCDWRGVRLGSENDSVSGTVAKASLQKASRDLGSFKGQMPAAILDKLEMLRVCAWPIKM